MCVCVCVCVCVYQIIALYTLNLHNSQAGGKRFIFFFKTVLLKY